MRTRQRAIALLFLFLCLGIRASHLFAAQERSTTSVKKVYFTGGATSATYSGTVRAFDSVRYEVFCRAGQQLTVKLTSGSTFLYCNILNASTDTVLATTPAPREVTNWSGLLPKEGMYAVQVYQVRAEARRGATANYQLSLSLGGSTSGTSLTELDYETKGSGSYVVENSGTTTPVRKVRILLKRDQSAEIRVDLGSNSLLLRGKWRKEEGNRVSIDITRGFDDSSLKGTATLTLRNTRQWETLTMRFDFPRQKTHHRLTYQAAKG